MNDIDIVAADYRNPTHAAAVVFLLNDYASDPAGGGTPLSAEVRTGLPGRY